jgi:hypothetical protein
MYYIKLSADNGDELIYYCRNCGHEDTTITNNNVCVSKTNLKRNDQQYTQILNEYTKLDPTLPRVTNIICPNSECSTNKTGTPKEVIFVRYDDTNIKYVYLCAICDKIWKTDEQI